ncbi:Rpn family recombination-promoting nuclease/putative transposase [Enterobacter sichuanensis]
MIFESGSFVENSLRQSFSDVLCSLKTLSSEKYIYVLVERQSVS